MNDSPESFRCALRKACALLLLVVAGAGCSSDADSPPRDRVGSMPFPGFFSLYDSVDMEDLGRHRYGRTPRFLEEDEKERGIIYTTRAGFLDLAHVRVAIDSVRYYARHLRLAMERDQSEIELTGMDHAVIHLSMDYPPDWNCISPECREQFIEEASIRVGQRVAYMLLAWHEVITWFGYKSTIIIPEDRSAFCYEDTMSHVIGLRIAERALRTPGNDFDAAVTVELLKELKALGMVSADHTDAAVQAVHGVWWSGEQPLKRCLDHGFDDGVVYPWLVPHLPFAVDAAPEPFALPTLDDVAGYDLTDFCAVRIDPNIPQAQDISRHLPGRPKQIQLERDLVPLIEVVQAQMQKQFGTSFSEPWATEPGRDRLAHQTPAKPRQSTAPASRPAGAPVPVMDEPSPAGDP